jgi:hypothetical protein
LVIDHRRRTGRRILWVIGLGFFLGGFFTWLSERFLPDSVGRDFLTTAVRASAGPLSLDLVAFALTVGPVSVSLNVLTLVGVGIVVLVARSLL